jgi:hypothetical protein
MAVTPGRRGRTGGWITAGWVVGVVEVVPAEARGAVGTVAGAVAGVVAAGALGSVAGTSVGVTTGTVVVGDGAVLDAATPAARRRSPRRRRR